MRMMRWVSVASITLMLAVVAFVGAGRVLAAGPAVTSAGQVIVEPQAGYTPYVQAIAGAKRAIDVEAYLVTDSEVVQALKVAAARGVKVQVIVAGNPYDDTSAVTQERQEFVGTKVQLRLAPKAFERPYTFMHAKYLVVDPGGPGAIAILGSSNIDYSGLGGGNREYDWETRAPATVNALVSVFQADWNGQAAPAAASRALVLSPGSEEAIVSLISSAKHSVDIETEEFSDVRAVMSALEARLRQHVKVRMVVPASISSYDMRQVDEMVRDGASVVRLRSPYVHAKLVLVDDRVAFLGSENFSVSSLEDNREVGVEITGPGVAVLERQFLSDFQGK